MISFTKMAGTANSTTLDVLEDHDQQDQHCQDLYGL
jgi:hypothetical protein